MEKYVTNIKDLVIQVLTNGSEIKSKAEKGDALSCFQMGMIHMLGINTPIDFKKAGSYFGNQLLVDDSTANQLLGFIAECDGDFSSAFAHYANASKKNNIPLYNKVFEERRKLLSLFNTIGLLSTVFNRKISEILDNYVKGGDSKFDAIIMIATICNDESSCVELAQHYFNRGDFYSAKKCLLKGKVDSSHPLFFSVNEKKGEFEMTLKSSNWIDVIEIEGCSVLEKHERFYGNNERLEDICDSEATSCKREWTDFSCHFVESLMKDIEEEKQNCLQKKQEETDFQKKLDNEDIIHHEVAQIMETKEPIGQYGKILRVWGNNKGNTFALNPIGGVYQEIPENNTLIKELLTEEYRGFSNVFIHSHIIVNGLNGKACKVTLRFKSIDGEQSFDESLVRTPNSDNCEWEDFQICLSYVQLLLKKDGRYNYEASILLYDHNNNLMDTSTIPIKIDFVHHMFKDDEISIV